MQLAPIVIYMTCAYLLMMLGLYGLLEDHAVVNHACGHTYHVWKYGFLNMILWVFATVSYCVWKGGGEGARARAMVLTIFYFAFFTWGALLWQTISSSCHEVMNHQFHAVYVFHHASTVMNGLSAFMFLFHEAFLGKYIGADLTVMADVQHCLNVPYEPRGPDIMSPAVSSSGIMTTNFKGPNAPTELSPHLSYEYEKIMSNTSGASASKLPQNTLNHTP